jgi:hypothetical protein
MIDYLIFYSYDDTRKKFAVLSGESFINYNYENPLDDSSIVDLFNAEFGGLLIDPFTLLGIIHKTTYPHFLKTFDNGLIYLINIPRIDEQRLNDAFQKYRSRGLKKFQCDKLRWNELENTSQEFGNVVLNLDQFLENHYDCCHASPTLTPDQDSLITRLIRNRRNRKITKTKQQAIWSAFIDAQTQSLKQFEYEQIQIIYDYTIHGSTQFNAKIRELLRWGEMSPLVDSEISSHVDKAITIFNIIQSTAKYSDFDTHYVTVYRGLSFDPNLDLGQLTTVFKYNFNSTSLDFDIVANMFVPVNGSLFKIIIPAETPLLLSNIVSHYSYEEEVLLPPGLTFRVIKKSYRYNTHMKRNQIYYTVVLQSHNINETQKKLILSKNRKPLSHVMISTNGMIAMNIENCQILSVIKKLIKKFQNQNQPLMLIDPETNLEHSLQSYSARQILNEQVQYLITKKSQYQDLFNYDQEILPIKNRSLIAMIDILTR